MRAGGLAPKNLIQPTISLEMPVTSQDHYVFTVFRLLTDFVCLYNYQFWLSLCKIVRSSVILLLPLSTQSCISKICRKICFNFIYIWNNTTFIMAKTWTNVFVCSRYIINYTLEISATQISSKLFFYRFWPFNIYRFWSQS